MFTVRTTDNKGVVKFEQSRPWEQAEELYNREVSVVQSSVLLQSVTFTDDQTGEVITSFDRTVWEIACRPAGLMIPFYR